MTTDGTDNVWDTCAAGGGSGGGTWSTTTSQVSGQLINYPNNDDDVVSIGDNSTTTSEWWYDPNVFIGYLKGKFGIGTTSPYAALSVVGEVAARNFTATSTTVSTFPQASTTQLSVSDNLYADKIILGDSNSITIGDPNTTIPYMYVDTGRVTLSVKNGSSLINMNETTGDVDIDVSGAGDVLKMGNLSTENYFITSNSAVGIFAAGTDVIDLTNSGSLSAKLNIGNISVTDKNFTFPNWSGEFVVSTSTTQVSSINATSTADSTFAGSISFNGELMPDGATCSDGEILKRTGANDWDCATDSTSGGGGDFAWTPQSWGNSTTTTLGFLNGFLSTASSTINATTSIAALQVGSTAIGSNVLKLSPLTGLTVSNSESVGGIANMNLGTTDSIGFVGYTNSTGSNRLMSLVSDSASYTGNVLHVRNDGTEGAFNILGATAGKGVGKITHQTTGDADASFLSLDATSAGYLGQGIFIDCTGGSCDADNNSLNICNLH